MSVINETTQELKVDATRIRNPFKLAVALGGDNRNKRNTLLVGTVISLIIEVALTVGGVWLGAVNLIDIIQNGAAFWNVTWLVLASAFVLVRAYNSVKYYIFAR